MRVGVRTRVDGGEGWWYVQRHHSLPKSTNMTEPSSEHAANTTRHPPPAALLLLPLLLLLLPVDDNDDDDGGSVSVCVCMVQAMSVAAALKASRSTITGVCLLVLHRLTWVRGWVNGVRGWKVRGRERE